MNMETQTQFDLDFELAKKLQDEIYSEPSQPTNLPYGVLPYSDISPNAYATSPVYPGKTATSVKAPNMNELKAQAKKKIKIDQPSDNEEKICLVCHQALDVYIMLPSCKQEHIYCLDCADKMVKFGSNSNRVPSRVYRTKKTQPNTTANNNQSSIQCVLCKSISYLDGKSSLKSLRRKQKRKKISDKCSIHDQEFCLFDLDDNELICYVCAGTTHANHNFEALDKAHSIMSKELQEKLIQLSKKRKVFENFIKKNNGTRRKYCYRK